MKESFPTPEQGKVSKEKVIEAYKKFIERGVTHPDSMDLNDPEVKEANELFFSWVNQGDSNDPRFHFEKTKFYIDAGFTDPDYLEEVLDWLAQDAVNLEQDPQSPERDQLLQDIAQEQEKIKAILGDTGDSEK